MVVQKFTRTFKVLTNSNPGHVRAAFALCEAQPFVAALGMMGGTKTLRNAHGVAALVRMIEHFRRRTCQAAMVLASRQIPK
jgi:hypothetical protein